MLPEEKFSIYDASIWKIYKSEYFELKNIIVSYFQLEIILTLMLAFWKYYDLIASKKKILKSRRFKLKNIQIQMLSTVKYSNLNTEHLHSFSVYNLLKISECTLNALQ